MTKYGCSVYDYMLWHVINHSFWLLRVQLHVGTWSLLDFGANQHLVS